jgi:hypothetical protein
MPLVFEPRLDSADPLPKSFNICRSVQGLETSWAERPLCRCRQQRVSPQRHFPPECRKAVSRAICQTASYVVRAPDTDVTFPTKVIAIKERDRLEPRLAVQPRNHRAKCSHNYGNHKSDPSADRLHQKFRLPGSHQSLPKMAERTYRCVRTFRPAAIDSSIDPVRSSRQP